MDSGLKVQVLWHDADVLELRFFAWNGAFGGTTNVYVGRYGLNEIAEKLQGFPRNAADIRELELGAMRPNEAGGGLSIHAYCTDQAGHACLKLRIVSEYGPAGPVQLAQLVLPIEAAAVDLFVSELRQLQTELNGVATLTSRS